ncbi:hypothetical protein AGMMS49532_07000 [Endomicrobiia bacterium]|nr:hypothetical protein AGMMS49532_07000 [Endomicrobiia bacterium]
MEGRQLYFINKGEYNNGAPLSTQGYHEAVDFLNFIRWNKKELIDLVQDLSKSKKEQQEGK